MIKVLMITNRFIVGGIEQLLLNIFEYSNNPNIHYDLLTLVSEKDEELIKKVVSCGVGYYSLDLDTHYSYFKRQLYHYKTLYKFIKQNKYDVVHINITSYIRSIDMLTVKMAGVPTRIIHAHSADVKDTLSRKIIKPIRNLYDYSATHFLACSDNAAKYLFSKKINKLHKYTILTNGIDLEKFKYSNKDRELLRKRLGICNDCFVIGHVGRFTEAKNHRFIIDIFKEIHNLHENSKLLLIGDGELKIDIIKQIENLQLSEFVILAGSSSEVPAYLSAMDVFLFPSIWEGLGISVIEAECNGLSCYISEKVPETVCVTSNIHRLNIQDGSKKWANSIINNDNSRVTEEKNIQDAGYSILNTIRQIEQIYIKNN